MVLGSDYFHMTSTPVNAKTRPRVDMAASSPRVLSPNLSKIYVSCCSMLSCSQEDTTADLDFSYEASPQRRTPSPQTTPEGPEVPRRLARMRSLEQIELGVVETLRREEADEDKRNNDLIKRLTGSLQNFSELPLEDVHKRKGSRWGSRVRSNVQSIRRLLHNEASSSSVKKHRSRPPFISEPFAIPAGTVTPSKLQLLPLRVASKPEDISSTTDQGIDSGCFVSPDMEFPRTVLKNGGKCTFC